MNGISWNDEYHLIYIDSPVGVGYSVAGNDLPTNSMQNAFHINNFIVRFFELYPSLKKQDFYILGDSYAGHYIPAVTAHLIQNYATNKIKVTGIQYIPSANLLGIGIGNGWTDPATQVKTYSDFAYSAGLVDTHGRDTLVNLENKFVDQVNAGNFSGATNTFDEIDDLITNLFTNQSWVNIYNYRNNSGGNFTRN